VLFSDVAEKFLVYVDTHQQRELSAGQREQYHIKWGVLNKHFIGKRIADVHKNFLLALRDKRAQATTQRGTPVKNSTIRKDLTFVRLVLAFGRDEEKCLTTWPEFPRFRGEWKIVAAPRPFLRSTSGAHSANTPKPAPPKNT
jgi:hypothetical protein